MVEGIRSRADLQWRKPRRLVACGADKCTRQRRHVRAGRPECQDKPAIKLTSDVPRARKAWRSHDGHHHGLKRLVWDWSWGFHGKEGDEAV